MTTPHISDFISKCTDKINYHKNQSIQCRSWNNAVGLILVILASSQALLMTILPIYQLPSSSVAITSAVFSFLIIVWSKIRENYQFLALSIQHDHICTEFVDLHYNFTMNLIQYSDDMFDAREYEKNVIRYSSILNRSHLQHVSDCRSIFCCISKPGPELL